MKNIVLVLSVVIATIAVSLIIKSQSKKGSGSISSAETISMAPNRTPLACETTTDSLVEITPEKGNVSNSNYLKYQKAKFKSGKVVDVISGFEEPYKVGQTFLMAQNCKTMKEDQTIPVRERLPDTKDPQTGAVMTNLEEVQKTQDQIAAKDDCVNIFVLNESAGQMKLECGHMIDERVYLLRKVEAASKGK